VRSIRIHLPLPALLALALVACGGGDDDDSAPPPDGDGGNGDPGISNSEIPTGANGEGEGGADPASGSEDPPVEEDPPPEEVSENGGDDPAGNGADGDAEFEKVMAEIDRLVDEGRFAKAHYECLDANGRFSPAQNRELYDRAEVLKDLKRDAASIRNRIQALISKSAQVRIEAQKAILFRGDAAKVVLRHEFREAEEPLASAIAEMLVQLRDGKAFARIRARYAGAEGEHRKRYRDFLARLLPHADDEQQRKLFEQIIPARDYGGRAFADRFIASLQKDGAAIPVGLDRDEAEKALIAYVEAADASDDPELRSWAMGHATFAGLHTPGLKGEYWKNEKFEGDPAIVQIAEEIHFEKDEFPPGQENISCRWTGFLVAPEAGEYQLTIASDDGSRLFLNGKKALDNWGYHGVEDESGTFDLEAGRHPIKIEFMQGGGGAGMYFYWKKPGQEKREIVPTSALVTMPIGGE